MSLSRDAFQITSDSSTFSIIPKLTTRQIMIYSLQRSLSTILVSVSQNTGITDFNILVSPSGDMTFTPQIIDTSAYAYISILNGDYNLNIPDQLSRIIHKYVETQYYVYIGNSDHISCDIINGYEFSKSSQNACSLAAISTTNTGIEFGNVLTTLHPQDNLTLIFESPSNLYISQFPFKCRLIIDGSKICTLVKKSSDSTIDINSLIVKSVVSVALSKPVNVLNDFIIEYPGEINSFSYLTGTPIVYCTISQFYSKRTQYSSTTGIYGIYFFDNLKTLSFTSYSFNANDQNASPCTLR